MKKIENHDVKIFTDLVEDSAVEQIEKLLSVGVFSDCKIRIMPDVHVGRYYLLIHTGSRNLGKQVADHYQELSVKCMCGWEEIEQKNRMITDLIMDFLVSEGYARVDRDEWFESVHNYIGDDNIIRKGAISAREGEKCIIPLNMRDGALICEGKGNEEWNFSAPHGAGRLTYISY